MPLMDQEDNSDELIHIGGDNSQDTELPEQMPVLTLRNSILFPGTILPVSVGRKVSLALIHDVSREKSLFITVTQRNSDVEDPQIADLYEVGTVARVLKVLEMPDGTTTAIIQGNLRANILEQVSVEKPYLVARVSKRREISIDQSEMQNFEALASSLKDTAIKIIRGSGSMPPETAFAVRNIETSPFLINFIASNCDTKVENKQDVLSEDDVFKRGQLLLKYLSEEEQFVDLKNDIRAKVHTDLEKRSRDFLLQQEIRKMQEELGDNPNSKLIAELKERAKTMQWPKEAEDVFNKELSKLERTYNGSSEYPNEVNYLETLLDLPWNKCSDDNFDIDHAAQKLDEDHYGLEKVKERILEHLAVLKLTGTMKSPILCLYGPPGVGKTSLGKSIAEALGRKCVRMSLGGLHDEAEIRGHRRTYIGSKTGRVLENIKKAGTSNPVFILDEIDKVGHDFHGDPASALLEVLDPEQNSTFHDNYLELDYDLSKVMFIATANNINTISDPLLDRMELIDVSGYLLEEKIEIARRHLLPRQMKNHGIDASTFGMGQEAIQFLIEKYTRESGVRELDKKIATICRKVALSVAKGETFPHDPTADDLRNMLGVEKFNHDIWESHLPAGVVTGLAWTAVGGEILFVEASSSKGKGKMTLTGNLGDVMKESAILAVEYVRCNAERWKLKRVNFDIENFHIHVPEGAIPKDGPSAGVTMVTAIVSTLTGRRVKNRIAMTGEITLRGKVLPVGGIKEKILAAKRAGITDIILSRENEKDIKEIKPLYVEGLTFHYATEISEVVDFALEQ